ncbi:L-aspartate oxidase [Domibacillus aminovorans]|uniref:L-aspartate oxidase n=1 Tax=Domibacillus aminovorans TaxID=29332 RepID=A0A177LBP9_9BACI|nr:L-aspartate oxidase [Domibacillus aminovorans]OAH62737.1 L-aspartate oxidase [Domibacillus aminovorans]
MKFTSQVVIIGSGIAALQAAKHLAAQLNVIVITKSMIRDSNSYYAQGGIAAVMSTNDTYRSHIEDTVKAGEHHHSLSAVEQLVEEGAQGVQQLLNEGFPADRRSTGTLSLGLEGAHNEHRIVHSGGDATGKMIIEHLLKSMPDNVRIMEQEMAFELIVSNETCTGVKTKTIDGTIHTYEADHVVLATGGAGALYPFTSNRKTLTGDGIALAYRAGAVVTDMEFVQFHPTLLYVNGEAKGLVSEAVRGAGAVLVDESGRHIMEGIHPMKDLAPRHITAFELYKARKNGHDVLLDISMIDHFEKSFPTITALCIKNGIDIKDGFIPVAPGSHFLMGGVKADSQGKTSINGLYAIGETACTGVHGANRLASNSLLEGIAFGKRMAAYILSCDQNVQVKKRAAIAFPLTVPPLFEIDELQAMMMDNVGITRTKEGLNRLVDCLKVVENTNGDISHLSVSEIERLFMHTTAYLIARSALERTETRGAHIRADFPEAREQWGQSWVTFEKGKISVRSGEHEWNQTRSTAYSIFY